MARVVDEGTTVVPAAADGVDETPVLQVLRALRGLRYGSIEITVHDGEVVQIERREKVRLERRPGRRAG